jgi:NAD(P)-dependent dehydrogenase (short-subunit alcohol dehydrogenase family)
VWDNAERLYGETDADSHSCLLASLCFAFLSARESLGSGAGGSGSGWFYHGDLRGDGGVDGEVAYICHFFPIVVPGAWNRVRISRHCAIWRYKQAMCEEWDSRETVDSTKSRSPRRSSGNPNTLAPKKEPSQLPSKFGISIQLFHGHPLHPKELVDMPVPIISQVLFDGFSATPYASIILKITLTLGVLYAIKYYFSGATNTSERVLHGKVAIITGGTSGVGAAVVRELATRGTQLIILTRHPLSDPFLVDYIEDLRTTTGNELITVEQVDLADLYSVRKFATQWIDNTPPRRLDMLVLCGDEWTPRGAKIIMSKDKVERMIAINYLANFHLVSILSPAIRAQPPDRDVRILVGMCASYMGGNLDMIIPNDRNTETSTSKGKKDKKAAPKKKESEFVTSSASRYKSTTINTYGTSKLALFTFFSAFQKHLSSQPSPDGLPLSRRVICVDPGLSRTPGMRRYLTSGSLWGLFLYLTTYPLWWLVLKSPEQGAQSFLWAAMDAQFVRGDVTVSSLVKECRIVQPLRRDVYDEETQRKLWEETDEIIKALEQRSAVRRALEKKEAELAANTTVNSEKKDTSRQPGSRKSRKAETTKA